MSDTFAASLAALEFPKILEHVARFCLSDSAKEAALALRPLPSVTAIAHSQALFEETWHWYAEGSIKLRPFANLAPVVELFDPNRAAFHAAPAPLLEPEDLWAVKDALNLAANALHAMQEKSRPAWESVAPNLPQSALSALNRCIGEEASIKDEASPGLLLVRNELRSLHQGCLRRVKEYSEKYNIAHMLQDEYMTLASDRYVLPLRANFKGQLQGIIHDYSRTGETLYFEPMFLVEHNNRLQELKHEEREEERKVLRLLCDLLAAAYPDFLSTWRFLVNLDLYFGFVAFSHVIDGRVVPLYQAGDGGSPVHLPKARHPLLVLENSLSASKKGNAPARVQPVDITLRPEDTVLIISGGNAGGKTVALKTLGLVALMVFSGIPVPVASGASLPYWKGVHAFIGDEQSLDEHVSTFTGQIEHLATIWPALGPDHLLLLDEFGAGTDPSQGAALAQAVLDGILDKGAYALCATHFPALKTYALTKPHVRAASVLFDERSKKPLFHLGYDQVGASLALDVAREHGLPEEILKKAAQYLLLESTDMGPVLDTLNRLALQKEKELEELKKEERLLADKRRSLHERFEKERAGLYAEVRQKSADLMAAYKSGKATAKQALKDMSALRVSLQPEYKAPSVNLDPSAFTKGMVLRHIPWNKNATLLEWNDQKAKVDMNGVSLWAPFTDLEPLDAPRASAPSVKPQAVKVSAVSSGPMFSLDLRGKRADVALAELEQFLDKSLLQNREEVEIVHGRGTGALRKAVHEALKKFPCTFRTANEDQGGDGVTVVTFG